MNKISNDVRHYLLMDRLQSADFPKNTEKKAEKVAEPTLTELILKLSDSLRERNMGKAANEIEQKFIIYKQADTHLYRAHDEDGEDLIDFAHPKGDHNVEDGELGDVETIVSKHKKIIEVVQKNPTGKLASYVSQCKIALGQATDKATQVKELSEIFANWREYVVGRLGWIDDMVQNEVRLHWYSGNAEAYFGVHKALVGDLQSESVSLEQLQDAASKVDDLKGVLQGHYGFLPYAPGTGASKEIWEKMEPVINDITNYIHKMINVKLKLLDLSAPAVTSNMPGSTPMGEPMLDPETRKAKVDELLGKLTALTSAYEAKAAQVPQDQQKMYTDWFAAEKNDIMAVKTNGDYNKRLAELNEFASKSGL